jgi:hypothetical protein
VLQLVAQPVRQRAAPGLAAPVVGKRPSGDPEQPGCRFPLANWQVGDPPPRGGEGLGEQVGGVTGRIDPSGEVSEDARAGGLGEPGELCLVGTCLAGLPGGLTGHRSVSTPARS